MNNESENNFYQDFFAVLSGVLSAIITGTVIKVLFAKFLHFDPLKELSANETNLMIQLSVAAWLFVSSLVGGMVCAIIAKKNDLGHIIISSLVVLALYFLLGGTDIFKEKSILSWLILLAIPVGIFVGEWIGGLRNQPGE